MRSSLWLNVGWLPSEKDHFMKSVLASLFLLMIPLLAACSNQHVITGEPLVYGVKPETGELLDRDTSNSENANLVIPHKGEIITLVLNNVFIKYLKEIGSPHVLVYAQVFDDGTDNPDTAVTKVLYNERNSPEGVNLGLADRVLYGPTPFKGFPLRIKLFIVELDKEQKELASKIIDSVGSTAASAKPEAAPAIAVAVSIAKAINAMNEDDFELRFDMTLFPVSTIGKATTGDRVLDDKHEPSQRHGKDVSIVTPLRTGLHAIMKRELEARFKKDEYGLGVRAQGQNITSQSQNNDCGVEVSKLDFDYSQQFFTSSYADSSGGQYTVDEVLRYEGGYLYRIVTKITDGKKDLERITVRPCAGPNRGIDFSITPGIRQRFTDRSYVVLSVVTGLQTGLEPAALKAASERDVRQLSKLLDNPSDASLSERIGPEVDAIAASLKSALEQRRISAEATRRVGRDPSFRTSPDYALFWVKQIDRLASAVGTVDRRNAEAKNAAILETLAEIIVNLPILNPSTPAQMSALHTLTSNDLEKMAGKPGIFRLTDQGKKKLP